MSLLLFCTLSFEILSQNLINPEVKTPSKVILGHYIIQRHTMIFQSNYLILPRFNGLSNDLLMFNFIQLNIINRIIYFLKSFKLWFLHNQSRL